MASKLPSYVYRVGALAQLRSALSSHPMLRAQCKWPNSAESPNSNISVPLTSSSVPTHNSSSSLSSPLSRVPSSPSSSSSSSLPPGDFSVFTPNSSHLPIAGDLFRALQVHKPEDDSHPVALAANQIGITNARAFVAYFYAPQILSVNGERITLNDMKSIPAINKRNHIHKLIPDYDNPPSETNYPHIISMLSLSFQHSSELFSRIDPHFSALREQIASPSSFSPFVVLDPHILASSSRLIFDYETCLSLPGWIFFLKRPAAIRVRFWTLNASNEWIHLECLLSGLDARIFLHDFDHLNGRLVLDWTDGDEYIVEAEEMTAASKRWNEYQMRKFSTRKLDR